MAKYKGKTSSKKSENFYEWFQRKNPGKQTNGQKK